MVTESGKLKNNANLHKENEGNVPEQLGRVKEDNPANNTLDASATVPTSQERSVEDKTDQPKAEVETTTIQKIIESFISLDFISIGARNVEPISEGELISLLGNQDEFVFGETSEVPMYFSDWFDDPNRQYYIVRNSSHFITWSTLREYFEERLRLDERRAVLALNILREPDKVVIDGNRVCNPLNLGYPVQRLLDGTTNDAVFREAMRRACAPKKISNSYVELSCLVDPGVGVTNSSLIEYSRTHMPGEREMRNEFLSAAAVIERRQKSLIREQSTFDCFYPSFSPFQTQGVFDGLTKESAFRIHFSQPLVMPNVQYVPIAAAHLMKSANLNVTRVSFASDIINRAWKPEFGHVLWSYMLSLCMPGEVFFDVEFPDSFSDIPTKGFVALIMRLMLMYSENSILSNSTRETQQAIDRAIIAWGEHTQNLVRQNGDALPEFPLSAFKLAKATAGAQRNFEFLKVNAGQAGMCSNGCAYRKVDESMRRFYPNICPRYNYAIDADHYQQIRDSSAHLSAWRVYEGAMAFLGSSQSLAAYRNLFNVYGKRVLEFLIRTNEYLRVNWYNQFRMTSSRASTFVGVAAQGAAPVINAPLEFFLVACKGLDIQQFVPRRSIIERLRIQSAMVKEAFRVHRRLQLVNSLWRDCGSLESIPRRRRILIACSGSKIFEWLRTEMYAVNEDRLIENVLNRFDFQGNRLANCFSPLNSMSRRVERLYGILGGAVVNSSLNFVRRSDLVECMRVHRPFTNAARVAPLNQVSYRDIEQYVRTRRFHSVFYASSERPFALDVKFPYQVCHEIRGSENRNSLSLVGTIDEDVSYEMHVRVSPLKVLFMTVDNRNFLYEDDYVIANHRVDEVFPTSADVDDIIIPAERFFSTLRSWSAGVLALTTKDFRFMSMYKSS